MASVKDSADAFIIDDADDLLASAFEAPGSAVSLPNAVVARFHGFDSRDEPLIVGVPTLPGEVVLARATVSLSRQHIGASVLVLFEQGEPRRPIVVGVIGDKTATAVQDLAPAPPGVSIDVDDERVTIKAEREIVLRCGDASITLTRAGKVTIAGSYVSSRSTGYNKIKGAAVDIN
jgi:hypothetical protein